MALLSLPLSSPLCSRDTMTFLYTVLICSALFLSTFGVVGASRGSAFALLTMRGPAVPQASLARGPRGQPEADWLTVGTPVHEKSLRVFRVLPNTLFCAPVRRKSVAPCAPVVQKPDTEPSTAPKCRSDHLREGDRVPRCTWKRVRRTDEGKGEKSALTDFDSRDVFDGKRVVIIGLPGAFTPVCTNVQLPSFEKAYEDLKREGVDGVYCITVNDAFVTSAWAKHLKLNNVVLIADGNGTFTSKMGMLVRKSNLGFGCRSWRYAAVVKDGVLEKLFVEPCMQDDAETDPYTVSTPENVLAYLRSARDKPAGEADQGRRRSPATSKRSAGALRKFGGKS